MVEKNNNNNNNNNNNKNRTKRNHVPHPIVVVLPPERRDTAAATRTVSCGRGFDVVVLRGGGVWVGSVMGCVVVVVRPWCGMGVGWCPGGGGGRGKRRTVWGMVVEGWWDLGLLERMGTVRRKR
jgi:hypothetical protein